MWFGILFYFSWQHALEYVVSVNKMVFDCSQTVNDNEHRKYPGEEMVCGEKETAQGGVFVGPRCGY